LVRRHAEEKALRLVGKIRDSGRRNDHCLDGEANGREGDTNGAGADWVGNRNGVSRRT
jgi:hypothetical protein